MTVNLVSWNINGIRAAIKKNFWPIVKDLEVDVLGLQEVKANGAVMNNLSKLLNYSPFTLNSHEATLKSGYSGVATFSLVESQLDSEELFGGEKVVETQKPKLKLLRFELGLGQKKFDVEGRVVTTYYQTIGGEEFVLINGYYPQGGRGQFRIDYKLEFYKAVLEKATKLQFDGYRVILCGDFNTTVADIDLARPRENKNNTGCLPEERQALNWFFEAGFVDSFRYFYPDKTDVYTYWDQITRARERNVGWRIDYFLIDKKLLPNLVGVDIHDQVLGSDHCPVSVTLNF